MGTSRRAVRGNGLSRVVFGLSVVLLAFAPPAAFPGRAAEVYDFQICHGYFALCAASTCKPTGGQITVRTATGGTATFPGGGLYVSGHSRSVDCQLGRGQHARLLRAAAGPNLVDLSAQTKHSAGAHQLGPDLARGRGTAAVFCPKRLGRGNQLVNCFSFTCNSQTYINNVPVVTCHCPIGSRWPVLPCHRAPRF